MDIDPRRLVVLAALARAGSVQGAAELLSVSPSAVSQQVARLEREAGLALVVRRGRGVALTEAGAGLAERGRRIADELAAAAADVAARADAVGGRVAVAAFPTLIAAVLVPAAALVRERHPGLDLRIVELPAGDAARALRAGTVDLELVEHEPDRPVPPPPGVAEVVLGDDPFVLASPPGVPPPGPADLAGLAWVDGPPGATTRAVLRRIAAEGGWSPRTVHEALEYSAVLALVAGGLGHALVPRLAVEAFGRGHEVAIAPLPGLGARRVVVRHRASRHEPSRAAAVVLDVLTGRPGRDARSRAGAP